MQDFLIEVAVEAIHQKKCVVFPTETVYGLGANALSSESVAQIFKLKNRPANNPLIVHVPTIDDIYQVAESLSPLEISLLEQFAPGPLSLVLKKKDCVPNIVTGGLDSVGVRIPKHPVALEFLSQVKKPICAPSANISGKPSPTTYEMASFYMKDQGVVILDGGNLDIGLESTVIKVEYPHIYLLRAGAITSEMIFEACGIIPQCNLEQEHRSPGTQFAHYKPKASIILFPQGTIPPFIENSALLCLSPNSFPYRKVYHFANIQEYSHSLYDTFFQCDKQKIPTIICELPEKKNIGLALYDRLIKAAK
ncbi:MAG: L-threonylcarbamoyladenylate synthase [Brevinema sp.]